MKLIPYDKLGSFSETTHERMALALKVAALSDQKQRHGAVLMQGSRLLALGINKQKNEPDNVGDDHVHRISVHAEVAAVRAHKLVPNTSLYVARLSNGEDSFIYSRPCKDCLEYLTWDTSVKKIVYSL